MSLSLDGHYRVIPSQNSIKNTKKIKINSEETHQDDITEGIHDHNLVTAFFHTSVHMNEESSMGQIWDLPK